MGGPGCGVGCRKRRVEREDEREEEGAVREASGEPHETESWSAPVVVPWHLRHLWTGFSVWRRSRVAQAVGLTEGGPGWHAMLCGGARTCGGSVMRYRVLIEQDEDGAYVAEVPALPGCISEGRTRSEAIENVREAIAAYVESLKAHGEPVPPPITEEVVEVNE